MEPGDRQLLPGVGRRPVGDLWIGTARAGTYHVATATNDSAVWHRSMDQVRAGAFEPNGTLARLGVVAGEMGWYAPDSTGRLTRLTVPKTALPRWSPDGSHLASFTLGDATVALGTPGAPETVRLDGAVNGLNWTPAGDALYAIVLHQDGLSSLEKISLNGSTAVVRTGSTRAHVRGDACTTDRQAAQRTVPRGSASRGA